VELKAQARVQPRPGQKQPASEPGQPWREQERQARVLVQQQPQAPEQVWAQERRSLEPAREQQPDRLQTLRQRPATQRR
jgi:hypothetical protein